MKVEYALVSQYSVLSLYHNKRRISYSSLEEIINTKTAKDGIDPQLAVDYKNIADQLLSLNLILFASEFVEEAGGLRRIVKASSVVGRNRYELDLRTMEETITTLK